jgi:hypothetical protein
MIRRCIVLCAVAAALSAPCTAGAQSGQPISLQGSFLLVGLSGDAYTGLNAGIGGEAQIRYNFPNALSLGAGPQYSRHSFSESEGIDAPLTLFGAFVEPRYVIVTSSPRFAPYVSARVAFLRQSTDFDELSVSATGVQLNGGGGFLVRLTSAANLDVGLTVGAVSFGNYSTGDEAGSGTNYVFRIGLSAGIGK